MLVLLDFSKAFDVVSHNILLKKLENIGISGNALHWFKTYLDNRKQYVQVEDTSSSLTTLSCGVPQGSILGPLLFNIYTNDFNRCHNAIHSQYADDTAILITDKDSDNLSHKANTELKRKLNWVDANKLSLNLEKTSYLFITNLKNPPQLQIKIRDTTISQTPSAKLLGIILDEKLCFKEHINGVTSKLSRIAYTLLYTRTYLSKKTRKLIYYSLAHPILLYGISIWGGTSAYHLSPLITLHKKVLRIIKGTFNPREHSQPIFKEFQILQLNDMLSLAQTSQIFKITNGMHHNNISIFIESNQHRRLTNLRSAHANILIKSNYQLSLSRRSLSYTGIDRWNELPPDLKNIWSLFSFRKKVKSYLIEKY